jgi:hypothetical protein
MPRHSNATVAAWPRFMVPPQSRLRELQPVLDAVPLGIIVSQPIRLRATRAINEVLVRKRVGDGGLAFDESDERDHGSSVPPSMRPETWPSASPVHLNIFWPVGHLRVACSLINMGASERASCIRRALHAHSL